MARDDQRNRVRPIRRAYCANGLRLVDRLGDLGIRTCLAVSDLRDDLVDGELELRRAQVERESEVSTISRQELEELIDPVFVRRTPLDDLLILRVEIAPAFEAAPVRMRQPPSGAQAKQRHA